MEILIALCSVFALSIFARPDKAKQVKIRKDNIEIINRLNTVLQNIDNYDGTKNKQQKLGGEIYDR